MHRQPRRNKFRKNLLHKDPEVLEATSEQFRIEVDAAFRNLITDPTLHEFSFPSTLNNLERKYIHQKALTSNMASRSHGKDPNRVLTISKKRTESNFESFYISLTPPSQERLNHFIQSHVERPSSKRCEKMNSDEKVFGRLLLGKPPEVIEARPPKEIETFQKLLPINELKQSIIEKIRKNNVIVVTSETGSGKTTQIPQYILDNARLNGERCRIVCTQPRRISAVSVASRVASERGSEVGETVGYHIRLQSKLGTRTNLIYCTNGVLIRSLMSGDEVLSCLTHVIIDEVHERDKLSDFLLICLREYLRKGRKIKIILMSATINVEKFCDYFGSVEVISVPGRLFMINEQFLDDILQLTNYEKVVENDNNFALDNEIGQNSYYDELIASCFNSTRPNDGAWDRLLMCIFSEGMPLNYRHSEIGYTALMVAVVKQNVCMVEKLCRLGCSVNIKTNRGHTALNLAEDSQNPEILLLLRQSQKSKLTPIDLLTWYHKTVTDEEIDYDLMIKLINKIHKEYRPGAILVFLPGYDDIMLCRDRIVESDMDPNTYKIFFLHSFMDIKEQGDVFKYLPRKRKIILSTNIAETSLTIDDVLYVINSGKAKEQTYDSVSGLSALQVQWISKACVKQRAGRAGRTYSGICFHMFSKARYESFIDERIPEILRVPLEELCLNTKSIAGNFASIYNFLKLAPDPPSTMAVKNAVANLTCLGALDENEQLTPLGEYLSQLTIEPHLGKMLIYSVIFKCLDPILTIVSSLAQKDPFQLPPQANLRTAAAEKRKRLTDNILSDHLIYLKAFNKWQESKMNSRENHFCNEFFISKSTMNVILKTRCQLVGQLRAAKFISTLKNAMKDLNAYSENWPLVKAVISSGLYPKFAYQKGGIFCTRTEKKVLVHNSSTLSRECLPLWLVYDDMIKVRNSSQIRGITPITPITVTLICGVNSSNPMLNYLNVDDWLEFEFPNQHVIILRKALEQIIEKILQSPLNSLDSNDNMALKTFADVIYHEDVALNMAQPLDINRKPKFFEQNLDETIDSSPLIDNKKIIPTTSQNGRNYGNFDNYRPFLPNANYNCAPHEVGRSVLPPIVANMSINHPTNQMMRLNSFSNCQSFEQVFEKISNGEEFKVDNMVRPNPNSIIPDMSKSNTVHLVLKVRGNSAKISHQRGQWVFAPKTEKTVTLNHSMGKTIYLIYSDPESKKFYGIAQFIKMLDNGERGTPHAIIDWKITMELPFSKTRHLRNPLCNTRLIHDAPDGQVIDNEIAKKFWEVYVENGLGRPIVKSK